MESNIRSLVEGFVSQIVAAIEKDSVRRVRDAVSAALVSNASGGGRPGRSPRATTRASASSPPPAPKRRRPKQFCPVPGCSGVAAPVFGMVCAEHKDLPKGEIQEYRAQRRAEKAAN